MMGKTMTTMDAIDAVVDEIRALLKRKNDSYGDSAMKPVRIFSRSESSEQIKVRIDDKLSRIASGKDVLADENMDDTVNDLIGYLVLMRAEKIIRTRRAPQ